MPQADDLLSRGDISGARDLLTEQVRSDPGNFQVRMFLFQIFALTGEWKRAKSQLDVMTKLDPAAQMLSVAYSQCIEAEQVRRDIFLGQTDMNFLGDVSWATGHIENLRNLQTGSKISGSSFSSVFNDAEDSPGTSNSGLEFDFLSDVDPRFGPSVEAIIAGQYGLMPFECLENITVHPAQDLKDMIWLQAEFGLRKGARIAGFIPARYPGSEHNSDEAIIAGRATDWEEIGDFQTSIGHRLIMFSDGSEIPISQLGKLEFGSLGRGA